MLQSEVSSKYPQLGYGLGLRPEHFDEVLNGQSQVDWFEILAENYMGIPEHGQSPLLKKLLRLREKYPIVFHCVSINVGGQGPLDFEFLKELKKLKELVAPSWISDHLCWTGLDGKNSHELLPMPYTLEAVHHVSERIMMIQDFFKERFMIENTSSYITYQSSQMSEWDFISEIVKKTDCGILLDVNNVYVSSQNHHFSPEEFISNIPLSNVGQIHIAGHDRRSNGLIVDTHDSFVCEEVYDLIHYLSTFHQLPSLMAEWDENLPDLKTYESQVLRIKEMLDQSR